MLNFGDFAQNTTNREPKQINSLAKNTKWLASSLLQPRAATKLCGRIRASDSRSSDVEASCRSQAVQVISFLWWLRMSSRGLIYVLAHSFCGASMVSYLTKVDVELLFSDDQE